MGDVLHYRTGASARGDNVLGEPVRTEGNTEIVPAGAAAHPLDSQEARDEHRRILSWYYYERDRQAQNRMEQALDHEFYDGQQWDAEDAAVLAERKQMPLVYNELAPMCDWLIGTERRARVDWKVLPRTEDDVSAADVKTSVMKYLADVNRSSFVRSRAFADAIKGGIGWIDDGIRDDPTQEIIYSRYEDWRNVLMDSSGTELTGEDARYVFRWRWVDEDVALMMFPQRADKIRAAVEDWAFHFDPMDDEVEWQGGLDAADASRRGGAFNPLGAGAAMVDAQRRRVKLIECQYRKPVRSKMVASGPLRGAPFDERDRALVNALNAVGGTIIDRVQMRVYVAVMTEAALLALGPTPYRHNQFSLTPVVCYRRGATRQWYGAIRRVRSIQQDLNKRASKALFMLNTNQLIGDRDAVDDWEMAREEAQRPDGVIPTKPGTNLRIQRDTDAATGQLQLMQMAAQSIQKSVGVNDENLGRRTNAVSGEAIRARQIQGSVSTTEPFDNLRAAVQAQGQKVLSLAEQFMSEEKVLRLTGARGAVEWVRINQPEVQPDGSVRWLNDITASLADFIVSEQDYAGTLRQVMFDAMMQLGQRLPPEIALRFLRMAFEFSDLPNKDEIAGEIRRLTGETDPDKQPTPEEQQRLEEQAKLQAEAMQMQREQAAALLDEQRAKAREVNMRAEKLAAEIETIRAQALGGAQGDAATLQARIEHAAAQVREQAAREIEALTQRLAQVTADQTAQVTKVRADADTAVEVARINAAAKERVAEIEAASTRALDSMQRRLDDLAQMFTDSQRTIKALETRQHAPQPAATAEAAPAPAPAAPLTINVQVDATKGEAKKSIVLRHDEAGNLVGAEVQPSSTGSTKDGGDR